MLNQTFQNGAPPTNNDVRDKWSTISLILMGDAYLADNDILFRAIRGECTPEQKNTLSPGDLQLVKLTEAAGHYIRAQQKPQIDANNLALKTMLHFLHQPGIPKQPEPSMRLYNDQKIVLFLNLVRKFFGLPISQPVLKILYNDYLIQGSVAEEPSCTFSKIKNLTIEELQELAKLLETTHRQRYIFQKHFIPFRLKILPNSAELQLFHAFCAKLYGDAYTNVFKAYVDNLNINTFTEFNNGIKAKIQLEIALAQPAPQLTMGYDDYREKDNDSDRDDDMEWTPTSSSANYKRKKRK